MALSEKDKGEIIRAAGTGVDLDTVAAAIKYDLPELLDELLVDDEMRREVRQRHALAMAVVMKDMREGDAPTHGREHWLRRVMNDKSYDPLAKAASQPPAFEEVMEAVRRSALTALR